MSKVHQAAVGRRKTWQGHDKRNADLCTEGAFELYGVITDASEYDRTRAGELIRSAFWLSDEAEKFQERENPALEEYMYELAEQRLYTSRKIVDLETDSVSQRINWWRAYRHGNNEALMEHIQKEHLIQFGEESQKDAKQATDLLLDAAFTGHDKDDWDYVDKRLEDYYRIVLPYYQE